MNPSDASGSARESSALLHLKILSAYLFTTGLSGFLLQNFTDIADPLVLIWIRLSQRANICRNLSDLLPVYAADDQARLLIHSDIDSRRNRIFDRMRISERIEHGTLPLLCAVADTDNFELFADMLSHTVERI